MPNSNLIRCPACRGKKDVMGAGMIYRKCNACAGVGYVEQEVADEPPLEEMPHKNKRSKKDGVACQQNAQRKPVEKGI